MQRISCPLLPHVTAPEDVEHPVGRRREAHAHARGWDGAGGRQRRPGVGRRAEAVHVGEAVCVCVYTSVTCAYIIYIYIYIYMISPYAYVLSIFDAGICHINIWHTSFLMNDRCVRATPTATRND
jgi:hypothetical protein